MQEDYGKKVHPDIDRFNPILNLVMSDLYRYGLVSVKELGEVSIDRVITKFGGEFCDFIGNKS